MPQESAIRAMFAQLDPEQRQKFGQLPLEKFNELFAKWKRTGILQAADAPSEGPNNDSNPMSKPNKPLPMFRPEQMDSIPQLSPEEKQRYKKGLNQLWTALRTSPAGSVEQREAEQKIRDFSSQLLVKMRERQRVIVGQAQQNQNAQASNSQDIEGADSAAPASGATQPSQTTSTTRAASTPAQSIIKIQEHIKAMSWIPPPEVEAQGPEEATKWSTTNKDKYSRAMMQMHSTTERLRSNENLAKTLRQKGAATTPEEQKSLQNIQSQKPQVIKAYQDAKRFVEEFRKGQNERRAAGQLNNG